MTVDAVEVLRRDSTYLRSVLESLTREDWLAPSACAGWNVRDVIGHIGCAVQELVDLDSLPPIDPQMHTERRQDQLVALTRSWDVSRIVTHYCDMVDRALVALAAIAENDTVVPLAALGSYPLHLIADGFAFDHYLHIRHDLLRPHGPLDRTPPPTDSRAVSAVLNWMLAALPQQNAGALAALEGVVDLRLVGPGGRTAHVVLGDGRCAVEAGPAAHADATVTCGGHEFTLWGTKRKAWSSSAVELSGRRDLAAAFCDAVRVY